MATADRAAPSDEEWDEAGKRTDRASLADGALKRVEVLWLNPACGRLAQGNLFMEGEDA